MFESGPEGMPNPQPPARRPIRPESTPRITGAPPRTLRTAGTKYPTSAQCTARPSPQQDSTRPTATRRERPRRGDLRATALRQDRDRLRTNRPGSPTNRASAPPTCRLRAILRQRHPTCPGRIAPPAFQAVLDPNPRGFPTEAPPPSITSPPNRSKCTLAATATRMCRPTSGRETDAPTAASVGTTKRPPMAECSTPPAERSPRPGSGWGARADSWPSLSSW